MFGRKSQGREGGGGKEKGRDERDKAKRRHGRESEDSREREFRKRTGMSLSSAVSSLAQSDDTTKLVERMMRDIDLFNSRKANVNDALLERLEFTRPTNSDLSQERGDKTSRICGASRDETSCKVTFENLVKYMKSEVKDDENTAYTASSVTALMESIYH